MPTTHGQARRGMHTATYRRWVEMHRRCLPGFLHHHRYYDRGIAVCKRWDSFENFLADMGECHDGLTLDRKNNDRGYMKSNCRWATRKEQVWNSTRTTLILFRGKLQSIRAWAKELGINRGTMLKGLWAGKSLSRICKDRDK